MTRGNKEAFIKEGNFVCECSREFEKSQSFYAHQSHCKIHLGDRYDESKHKGWSIGDKRAWSRGLTKETDSRVARISKLVSESTKGKPAHPQTAETKSKIAESSRYLAKNHLNGWKAGNNRVPNKYEEYTANFLTSNNISYRSEVVVRHSDLGLEKKNYYQLDFLVNESIDLEIDGSSHDISHDKIRDSNIMKKYVVYRINHHDSLEELEKELRIFLTNLNARCAGSSPVRGTNY